MASRIVSEMLLFALGIAITTFVIFQFNIVEDNIGRQSFDAQLSAISNSVMNVVKNVQYADNAYVRLEVPPKLSGNDYTISFINEPKKLLIISRSGTPSENFVREIFNIEESYMVSGSVVSGSRFIAVSKQGDQIALQRR